MVSINRSNFPFSALPRQRLNTVFVGDSRDFVSFAPLPFHFLGLTLRSALPGPSDGQAWPAAAALLHHPPPPPCFFSPPRALHFTFPTLPSVMTHCSLQLPWQPDRSSHRLLRVCRHLLLHVSSTWTKEASIGVAVVTAHSEQLL